MMEIALGIGPAAAINVRKIVSRWVQYKNSKRPSVRESVNKLFNYFIMVVTA